MLRGVSSFTRTGQARHACVDGIHGNPTRPTFVVCDQLAIVDQLIESRVADAQQQASLPRRNHERLDETILVAWATASDAGMSRGHPMCSMIVRRLPRAVEERIGSCRPMKR
jgi:predicted component of type VI protein secretion system